MNSIIKICISILLIVILISCNNVKKSQSSNKTETISVIIRDTIHYKFLDTSKITTELQEFITKTIEIFDTTYTEVPQIRQRIIYENIKLQKEINASGITKDSSATNNNSIKSATTITNTQTKQTNRIPWYLIFAIVIIVFFYIVLKKFNILK